MHIEHSSTIQSDAGLYTSLYSQSNHINIFIDRTGLPHAQHTSLYLEVAYNNIYLNGNKTIMQLYTRLRVCIRYLVP
jgi:hypothetical protein